MKKIIYPIFILLLLSSPLFSQTLSGSFDNRLQATEQGDIKLSDQIRLNLKFTTDPDSRLKACLMAYGQYDSDPSEGDELAGDVERLYIQWDNSTGSVKIQAGRLGFRDSTGLILNDNLDGIKGLFLLTDNWELLVEGAYSGLTFDSTSSMVKTIDEYNEEDYFSPSRLIGQIKSSWEDPSGRSLYAAWLGQMGLDDSGKDYLTWYGAGGGELPLLDWVFQLHYAYNGGFTPILYSSGCINEAVSAQLFLGGLSYYPSAMREKGLKIQLTGLYTSGDGYDVRMSALPGASSSSDIGVTTHLFSPISMATQGALIEAVPGNLIRSMLKIGMVPVKGSFGQNLLYFDVGCSAYFRPMHGPINVNGLNSESTRSYLGTEINGNLKLRPLSDLGLQLNLSAFMPDVSTGGVFEGSREQLELDAGILVSLAF